jgi:hypothetical protein
MARLLRESREQQAQGLVYISVIGEECKPPNAEVRRALLDEFSKNADACEVVFLVVEGSGLLGGALRTVIAGMMFLAGRRAARVSVVDSLEAVISARRAAGSRDSESLSRLSSLVRQLRAGA